jgi:alanyl-tRNA synthetase
MPATARLYYEDSRLLEFDARVIGLSELDDGQIAVTLDRTAFYPTGGGQPTDTGTLGDARVVDCIDVESDGVLHVIQGPAPEIGDAIHGKIDWLRRLDHLQQHTGQHILSASFVQLFDAPTLSFRMLDQECEIDVALEDPSDERVEQAVDLANQIIWESRPISIRQVTSAEAAALPLRKEPARDGDLRVIDIDGFDLTPCGGTHAKSTGEVGVITARLWERAKGLTRIHFMAGARALADYRKANHTAREVAALFSAGREDSPALVERLVEENKRLRRRTGELEEIACRVEAEELLRGSAGGSDSGLIAGAPLNDPGQRVALTEGAVDELNARIIAKVFDDRDADSLKHLALALIAHPNTVALLGSRDGETARLVFARAPGAPGDMNALMRAACVLIDGRGGGRPDMAQGGGKNVSALDEAIRTTAQGLIGS